MSDKTTELTNDIENGEMKNSINARWYVAVIVFIVSVVGYVVLAIVAPHEDYRGIFLFAAQFAVLYGLGARVENVNQKTDTIVKNTNGLLSKHVDDVAEAAVKKAKEDSE